MRFKKEESDLSVGSDSSDMLDPSEIANRISQGKPPGIDYRRILQQHGFAQIAGIGGNSSADFTHKPGVSNESFVLLGIADLEAEVVQIAEVFVVARMRHTCLNHRISP